MSGHHHDHGHGGHDHHHEVSKNADRRYLWAALIILVLYMAAEVVAAFWSGSLALLADAGHMLSDAAAIGAALFAMTLAARPKSSRLTFGWQRAEILTAAINGLTLLVVGGVLGVEAIKRLWEPPHVDGWPVLIVALVGIVVNIIAVLLIAKANRDNLNIEGAYQHILTDLYGFIGTALAGAIILLTGWTIVDPIISMFVVYLMVKAGWSLVAQSVRILAQATPVNVNVDDVKEHLRGKPHVVDVHDVHAWTLTSGLHILSAHVVVEDDCFTPDGNTELLETLQACLKEHFEVEHTTLQLESASMAKDRECYCV